jgi:hypothetical protein
MTRLFYKATLIVVLLANASIALGYVLPASFIGRVLGERGLNARFDAIEFSMRSEKTPEATYSVKVSKEGRIELVQGERFIEGKDGQAKLEFIGEKVEIIGDFTPFPGSPALWSGLFLYFLDAEDADAVEVRWKGIAEILGLKNPQSELTRFRETICYALSSEQTDKPSSQLLVARGDFKIIQWSPTPKQEAAPKTAMRLLDYENSPAPKWLPHYLEFDLSNGSPERFEILDVQFHKPSETQTP